MQSIPQLIYLSVRHRYCSNNLHHAVQLLMIYSNALPGNRRVTTSPTGTTTTPRPVTVTVTEKTIRIAYRIPAKFYVSTWCVVMGSRTEKLLGTERPLKTAIE